LISIAIFVSIFRIEEISSSYASDNVIAEFPPDSTAAAAAICLVADEISALSFGMCIDLFVVLGAALLARIN
jgi:hypothetical protein